MRATFLATALFVSACTDASTMMGDPDAPGTPDAGNPDAPSPGLPTAAELRTAVATCDPVIGGPYAKDSGGAATVSICGGSGFVHWTADLDVDCDGKESAQCNLTTDPYFMSATAANDSTGQPLDAAALPYVVLPGRGTRWDYRAAGLAMGSVFAVVHADRVEYGVAGDIGPTSIIGEASYGMADALGIDPDPRIGGTDADVIYIGFTGMDAVVDPIEDHDLAVAVGAQLARSLVTP